jgi:hypothetical protein
MIAVLVSRSCLSVFEIPRGGGLSVLMVLLAICCLVLLVALLGCCVSLCSVLVLHCRIHFRIGMRDGSGSGCEVGMDRD